MTIDSVTDRVGKDLSARLMKLGKRQNGAFRHGLNDLANVVGIK